MNRAPTIAGIGEVLWDKFPNADRPGGAPANFAFHANQLGMEAIIVSRVGSDADGVRLLDQLQGHGLCTDYIQVDPVHATGTVTVELKHGQPSYIINGPVAWDFMEITAGLKEILPRLNAICFGTLAQRHAISRRTIEEIITLCSKVDLRLFDINLRQSFHSPEVIDFGLRHSTVLKLNDDEVIHIGELFGWKTDAGEIVAKLFDRYPLEVIALTKGAKGCELHARSDVVRSSAVPVECIDAVGAGDAFSAMLAVGLLRKMPLSELADQCNRVGGYVAGKAGAMPKLPMALTGI